MTAPNRIPERKRGLARVIQAGMYSVSGLLHAARHEQAFRQECLLACVLIPLSLLVPVTPLLKLILLLCMLIVMLTELLNTAIEAVVDHASPEFHQLAKQAKDMGSAAVLISLVMLAAAWAFALAELL